MQETRETQVQSLGWEDPLEKTMATHSSILAWGVPKDRGAWRAAVHGVAKSRTSLTNEAHTLSLSHTLLHTLSLTLTHTFFHTHTHSYILSHTLNTLEKYNKTPLGKTKSVQYLIKINER